MIRKAHCLFEQSGTFKNEFIKLGIPAEDYDLQNEFGETDNICDLFEEIRGGYNHEPSIFDDMTQDDIVIAFFPCTRFENQIQLWFAGNNNAQKGWSEPQKLKYDLKLHSELSLFYEMITKLALIAFERGLRLIIENPANNPHYLFYYWSLRPKLIDKNRREDGDYYEKPTQYWFINCEPQGNFIFEPLQYVEKKNIQKVTKNEKGVKTQRSLIHPQYASRFIKKYILEEYNTLNYWEKGE